MKVNNNEQKFTIYSNYKNNEINKKEDSKKVHSAKNDSVRVLISNDGKSSLRQAKEKIGISEENNIFENIPSNNIKELPVEYEIENYFKIPMRAKALDGSRSPFENNEENQWYVFTNYLKKNGMNEEKLNIIQNKLKKITCAIDQLNASEGYRGCSVESVAYIEVSKVALEHLNDTFVTDNLKEGFNDLILEYSNFNNESRSLIMKEMIPSYMAINIGKDTKYKYKSEIINSQKDFYDNEQSYFLSQLSNYYNDDNNVNEIKNNVEEHLRAYYSSKYQYTNEKNAGNQMTMKCIDNIMSILNY